jgi:hypothetical protein
VELDQLARLDPDGEIAYIIHRVEDVTPFIRQIQEQGRAADALNRLEGRVQHMGAEIVLRMQDLQRVNEQLCTSEEQWRIGPGATSVQSGISCESWVVNGQRSE